MSDWMIWKIQFAVGFISFGVVIGMWITLLILSKMKKRNAK